MKRQSLIVLLLGIVLTAGAQTPKPFSFFDERGGVRPQTVEYNQLADTLITIFHRADDVVWSRTVYHVIDMRYKQNFQLYFPVIATDPVYKSLFLVMLEAINSGLPVYSKSEQRGDIKPMFDKVYTPLEIQRSLRLSNEAVDEVKTDFLLFYDSISATFELDPVEYPRYVKNQLKFLVQEVFFFDKHTSRMHSKIIAIAPLYSKLVAYDGKDMMGYIYDSLLFWVSYDEFRPYLAKHKMRTDGNDKDGVTFDEFFTKKLYFSYIFGESNVYNRMILDYATTEEEAHREQNRIENELLTIEVDLWEN